VYFILLNGNESDIALNSGVNAVILPHYPHTGNGTGVSDHIVLEGVVFRMGPVNKTDPGVVAPGNSRIEYGQVVRPED
jgi:hypothetical protein